jgi:hypothetical protein
MSLVMLPNITYVNAPKNKKIWHQFIINLTLNMNDHLLIICIL